MKYPKLWNGSSPVGEALVRALQRTGAPFLNAHTADGVWAGKMGGLSEVKQGHEGLFLCLGIENPGAPGDFTLMLSYTARGAFFNTGAWAEGAFHIPSVFYVGRGIGVVPNDSSAPTYVFNITRRGKKFKPVLTAELIGADPYGTDKFQIISGGVAMGSSGKREHLFGFSTLSQPPASDEVWFVFTKNRGKNWQVVSGGFGPDFRLGFPTPTRLSPGVIWLVTPIYKVSYQMTQEPGFKYPEQHAHTFSQILRVSLGDPSALQLSAGDVFGQLADNVGYDYTLFNEDLRVLITTLLFTPLSDGTVLALAPARYYDRGWTGSTWDDVGNNAIVVFKGDYDAGFVRVGTISQAGWFGFPFNLMLLGRIPVFIARDEGEGGAAYLVVGDEAGLNWTVKSIPAINRHVGNLMALDAKTLVLNAYHADSTDPAYVLFESRNLGDTWSRRAVISRSPPPQLQANLVRLINYSALSFMQDNGAPAPVSPGAKWVSDDRITPPWETP